jgi:hypothetical protein
LLYARKVLRAFQALTRFSSLLALKEFITLV